MEKYKLTLPVTVWIPHHF